MKHSLYLKIATIIARMNETADLSLTPTEVERMAKILEKGISETHAITPKESALDKHLRIEPH